ncbi:MAG: tRNA uridine-5-carboxymethylaminomethyl(34) synthesis GTPase MnmE [Clostridia bacterium]|nr:tRNA uridine-5-carboxymethylaminomethyl(34) synthesis GTPase MnmE [Clostridia bacterium]
MISENIAAISTALAPAGVAVIRISGDSPLKVAEKIFSPVGKIKVSDFEPNKMYAGEIEGDDFKDFGLCVYFKAPKSFTGEDTVEFHSHGGLAITKGILKNILNNGARLAKNGEFTKRAFMNGKLSLSSAEGLIDMINSQSIGGVKAGYSLYREKLNGKITELQNELLDAISQIDVDIDFPEEDLESTSTEKVKKSLNNVLSEVDKLIKTFSVGRVIKDGVKVAICGKPNTGKSSILNSLLSYDKAIVSDIAGTTRDIVEGSIDINGVRFNFSDTAGIRESDNKIESLGVEMSKKMVESADIVLFIVDGGNITEEDESIYEIVKDKNIIFAINKIDKEYILDDRADIYISAKEEKNIEELKNLLFDKTVGKVDYNAEFLCEQRHYEALLDTKEKLLSALNVIDSEPLDIISIDVKCAWEKLGEITGKTATEEIINNIFSKFCVGK